MQLLPSPLLLLSAQLAITAEPDASGDTTVGINVLPVVVEYSALPRVGVRLNTVLNLQVSGDSVGLAQRGAGLTLPFLLPGAEDHAEGFYVGPHGALTFNPLVGGRDVTAAAEGGVRWRLGERGSLNLALQLGATHLDHDDRQGWVTHFGFFPALGWWIR